MRDTVLLAGGLLVVATLATGCGGGGNGVGVPPAPPANSQTTGDATGRLVGTADAANYTITVDGQSSNLHPGANGEFTIPGLPPGEHTIGLMGPGGRMGVVALVQVHRGRTTHMGDLTPGPTGAIAGAVQRELPGGGLEPVEGIVVMAMLAHLDDPMHQRTAPQPIGHGHGMAVLSAFTDAAGAYAIGGVPPGEYDVMAMVPGGHPDAQQVTVVSGQTARADLTIIDVPDLEAGTVEGTVTGHGQGPIEGAHVVVALNHPWSVQVPGIGPPAHGSPGMGGRGHPARGGMGHWVEMRVFMTVTDQQGHYSLDVPTGTHNVRCWAPQWGWQQTTVSVAKGRTITVDFSLPPHTPQ